ncbi:MAG: hybrid sensor histidine kinase/response regulator [Aggregatilineales bacterium]
MHSKSMVDQGQSDGQALGKRGVILVVEDDLNLLDGLRNILELEGYDTLTAVDGLEALEVLRRQPRPPDLILSDIMMPRMDGLELLETVRQQSQWLSIPFIFLTARGQTRDVLRAKGMGVDDYLIKPYDPTELVVAIEAKMTHYRRIRATHADELSELKRNILTILNHEFRTPLTFVVAYADMLNNPSEALSQADLVDFLRGVSAGAERLRRLIENFILLVELVTGDAKQIYDWRRHTITAVEPLLQGAWAEAQVARQCVITCAKDLPPFEGDDDYIKRALAHLIDNAAKFSEPDTTISVRAWAADSEVWLAVEDHGRGIPQAEIARVCDPFYQINRALYEDQGVGNGLAIARAVAELHGGRLVIESEVSVGSLVALVLPASAA